MLLVSKKLQQRGPDTGSSPQRLSPIIPQNVQQTQQVKRQRKKIFQMISATTIFILKSPHLTVSYERLQANAAFKCRQKCQNQEFRDFKTQMFELKGSIFSPKRLMGNEVQIFQLCVHLTDKYCQNRTKRKCRRKEMKSVFHKQLQDHDGS